MKQLLRTTEFGKRKSAHYHIVYLNDETGVGLMSTNLDHTHQIQFQPPQPPQMDEQGNVLSPEVPGQWIILPADDGHLHELQDYEPTEAQSKEEDKQIVSDLLDHYRAAKEVEQDSYEKAEEADEFYSGEQWEEETKATLTSLNRAALTINDIQKNIDELSGYERQQRTDLRYLPMEGGDQRVADLLNIVTKQICEQCYFERETSKAFMDAAITGRGLFNIFVTFENDLRGEVRIEKYPWKRFTAGEHEKEDLSDCEVIFKEGMFSLDKLKQMWPDKADELSLSYEAYQLLPTTKEHHQYTDDQYAHSDNKLPVSIGTTPLVNIARKEYLVLERWQRKYIKASVAVNAEDNFYFNTFAWKASDQRALRTIPGFEVVDRNVSKMRITKVAGNVLLSDENPANLPADDFFVVPIYAYKRGNEFWGKVEAAKDPQREVNKRHSQAVDIGNKMAAYGWFYDSNTFPENEKEKFKRIASSPGFMVELTDTNSPPKQVEGVKFPAELVQLMMLGKEGVSNAMNITATPVGANESGSAILQRQKIRMTGNEFLFDNLMFAKKKIGRLLVALIQKYYTPERILRLVNNAHAKQPVQVGGQDLSEYTEDEILDLLSNSDLSRYDVIVSESSYAPSARLANFLLLSDLAGKGIPVPPEVLVDLMDIPEDQKNKIKEGIMAQQQSQAQAGQAQADGEIEKTLVAKGIIPPAVRERMGLTRSEEPMQNEISQGDPNMDLAQ